jgi:hypothetical protein
MNNLQSKQGSCQSTPIVSNRAIFMTRHGRKQPRRAMASTHPLAKPLVGYNGAARPAETKEEMATIEPSAASRQSAIRNPQ